MIIYIAGRIKGREDTYKEIFKMAQSVFESQGHIVINPALLPVGLDPDRYMPICLSMIDAADAVYLLDGWEMSKGACMEKIYAEYQGKIVIEEDYNNG